jgi:hypothetical protein
MCHRPSRTLKTVDILSHYTPVSFSSVWRMQNILLVFDLLHQNPNFDRRGEMSIKDKIFYLVGNSDIPLQLLKSVLSPFSQTGTIMVNYFQCWSNFSLFNIYLTSLWILECNILSHAWLNSAEIWSLPRMYISFKLFNSNFNFEKLGSDTNGCLR